MPTKITKPRTKRLAAAHRAMTLAELMVAVVLLTIVAMGCLKVLSSVRRSSKFDESKTALALAAQTQLARLRAVPWDALPPAGRKAFEANDLQALGLDAGREISGEVEVRTLEGLEIKEITVRLEWKTQMGTFKESAALWRGKVEP